MEEEVQALLAAYSHVTAIIEGTASKRKAFNQYVTSFLNGVMKADWPFYYVFGEVKGKYSQYIEWRRLPDGLDGCKIAEAVDKENEGCVTKQTPGFEDMDTRVYAQHRESRRRKDTSGPHHFGLEMSCSSLQLRTQDAIKRCAFKQLASHTYGPHHLSDGELRPYAREACLVPWGMHFASKTVPEEAVKFCTQQITPSVSFKTYGHSCTRWQPQSRRLLLL